MIMPLVSKSWRGMLVSDWAIERASVRSSRTGHARVLNLHIWLSHEHFFDRRFFSCPSVFPLRSYVPLNKIWIKYDACHSLWTMHARVLKIQIGISHGKTSEPYFFLPELPPFLSVILSLLLFQDGQLSVSRERMCTILVNRLED